MTDTTLVLGGIIFKSFEIPEEFNFGGEQELAIHKLVGGKRVVDALGQDDADIIWSGRFQSHDALSRAQALDEMRKSGKQQTFTVAGLSYTVVVREFHARFQRKYQLLYTITLAVVQDNTVSPAATSSTLDDLVGSDMSKIKTLTPMVMDPTIAPAFAGLQKSLSDAGTLEGATLTTLAPASAAAANATSVVQTSMNSVDQSILSDTGSVGGIVGGGSAPTMIDTFNTQTATISEGATLQQLGALSGRIQTNLGQATGG